MNNLENLMKIRKENQKKLDVVGSNISKIVEKIQEEAPLKTKYKEAKLKFVKHVAEGYLEQTGTHSMLTPERTFGEYSIKIENIYGLQKLLKDIEIIDEGFEAHNPIVYLNLEKPGKGDLLEHSKAKLNFDIRNKKQKHTHLIFSSNFFLDKGSLINPGVSVYLQKSDWLGGLNSERISLEKGLKGITKNPKHSFDYACPFFDKVLEIL